MSSITQGRVNYTGQVGPCKHGIGKVVCDAVKDGGRCGDLILLYAVQRASSWPPCDRAFVETVLAARIKLLTHNASHFTALI